MRAMSLRDLLVQVDALGGLAGVERAREARQLSDVAMAELAAAGDEGVWEATRHASYAEVADELGVTVSTVNKAVRRYRQRALTEGTELDMWKPTRRARRA